MTNNAAVIAVYTKGRRSGGTRQWKGVHHVDEGAPWQLGNELLFRIRRARGDIEAVTQELVIDAPYGWQSISSRKTAEKTHQPRFYSPKIIRGHNGEVPAWVYLFDTEARRLDIYAVDLSEVSGHAPEPVDSATFDERGRSTPHQFVAPPPDWKVVPVAEGWDDEASEGIRERFTERIEEICSKLELDSGTLASMLRLALSEAAKGLSGDTLYSRFPVSEDSRVWELALSEGRTLRYPTRATRRHLRSQGVAPGDHLRLANDARDEAAFQLGPSELTDLIVDGEWPGDWPEPEPIISLLLLAVATAKVPVALYSVDGLQLIRAKEIVEEVRTPLREVAFADVRRRDKRARLGELEKRPTSVDFIWTVMDWLRSMQS